MSTKQAVIEMIQRLPDDASVEDIMADLYFRQKVEDGLRRLDVGEGIQHEQARRQLAEWLVPPTTKQAVIEMIERLPADVSVGRILAELWFRQTVDEAVGEVMEHLDAASSLHHSKAKRWLRNRRN